MLIEPGTFVRLKRDPSCAGILLEGQKAVAGSTMVQVHLTDGQVKWLPYSALEPVPSAPERLADRFANGRFVEPDWLRRNLTRLRVTGRLSDVVYSMEATETDFYAHQFKPVIKLMDSPTDSMLVADEVGLGKTIEAGLVWTELRARLDCDRLLIACPKTLCQKWQDELAQRFGVDAQIAGARELLDALRRTQETGRGYALVCSMQGLRPPRDWDEETDGQSTHTQSPRYALARFLDEASHGEPLIDLFVVDEAHHMRNPKTMLNRFGGLANAVASHRLFLSATPIHLRNRDLHSLLVMVDPDTFEFEGTLEELIETNAPVIAARDLLLNPDSTVADIEALLDEAQRHEILRGSQALAQIRIELPATRLDTSKRSELATRIERVNQLANYVTRTRRRDTEEFRVVREPKAPVITMSPDERSFYEAISEVVIEYAKGLSVNERFLLSSPQRLLTSSLAAASAYWCGSVKDARAGEVEETDEGGSRHERPLLRQIAARARALDLTASLTEADTKFTLLVRELDALWQTQSKAKVIVFSSFKPTLRYLQKRLDDAGTETELLHGSVTRPRTEILTRFRDIDDIRVLLSSEVGSEGVDLQFSAFVVNYDLPWNPMRLEQRIGRVDRLGQQSEKVTILNLIHDDTIDRRIYDRLYERLQIGRRALGELESVLGEPMRDITIRLFDPALSKEQKEAAIEQTALALQSRRHEEEQLEAAAGSLVRHGDYILERIMESRDRQRWLTGEDILVYVRDRVLQDFPGSIIETSPPGSDTYRIDLSSDAAVAFQTFLSDRGLNRGTSLLRGSSRQRYRFTSSVVQRDGRVECISQLHPLVRFAAARDAGDRSMRNAQAVAARVDRGKPIPCAPGLYVLAAQRWSSGAHVSTTAKFQIGYAGANVATRELLETDLAEQLMASAAERGHPIPNAGLHPSLPNAHIVLRDLVQHDLDERFGAFVARARAETLDRFALRHRALTRHFSTKIGTLRANKAALEAQADVAEIMGDPRRARNLRNLALARAGRIERLSRTQQLRASEMKAQTEISQEASDVGCLLLEVV